MHKASDQHDCKTGVLCMKLGFVSDSLGAMSFKDMMDHAARMGVQGIEVNTCGWSTAPHCKMDDLLRKPAAQKAFQREFALCLYPEPRCPERPREPLWIYRGYSLPFAFQKC